jgi:hypothetical protein
MSKGGGVVFGWSIAGIPAGIIEAEFHAIWKTPAGSYIDITPSKSGLKRILFLPDPSRIYENRSVLNFQEAVFPNDSLSDDLLKLSQKRIHLIADFENPKNPNEIVFPNTFIAQEFQDLTTYKIPHKVIEVSQNAPNTNDDCRCESGKVYSECCSFL